MSAETVERRKEETMELGLARNWWALALRGLVAILFGLVALVWPGLTLQALVLLFGVYALVDGVLALATTVRAVERHQRWWPLLLEGVLDLAIGLITLVWPGITALVLLVFIASWAILTGATELISAIRLRRVIAGEWLLGLSGVASLVFGLALLAFPSAGALAVVWLIGVYALFFGVVVLVLAFRLRGWQGGPGTSPAV